MSSVGIHPPKTPVTKGSLGTAKATIPNVCKMPGPPAPFVPSPLPNIAKSGMSPKGYSKKVKIEGNTVAIRGASFKSMGDMASKGTGGGLISANTHGPAKFITPGSLTVKIEGKNVHLLGEPMLNNCAPSGSPPNTGATLGGVGQEKAEEPKKCPPHSNPQVKEKNRAEEEEHANQVEAEAQQAVNDAQKELSQAEAALKVPHKKRPPGTRASTLRRNVDIARGRLAQAEGRLDAARDKQQSLAAERKVAEDEGGGRNILITCGVCNDELAEIDVLTGDDRAKEVKQSERAYDSETFKEKKKWLSHPAVTKVIGTVTAEVAIVNSNSDQITKNLEANNSELAGRTQPHDRP